MLPNRQALADSKCWGTGWVLYRSETVDGGFEEPYRLWGLCVELGGSTDYPSATWPTEADARIPLQGRPACRGSRSPSSGAASLPTCASKPASLALWRLSGGLLQAPLLLYTYERPGQRRTCREVGAQSLRALLEIRQPGCQREIASRDRRTFLLGLWTLV